MSSQADEATAALAAMQESRERLAAAANCPPERHLAFAGLMGGLVAAQGAPDPFNLGLDGALLAGVALVIMWDRRRTGMFINGYRAGPTRRVTFAMLAFALSMLAFCDWLMFFRGVAWAPFVGGAVVAVVAYFASSIWQRIYLRELRAAP
ncbi:MAG TPA: hypothetical protein VKQ70_01865 [Caulobacteraceae bacterium]|jgi:hypothetical protein|nr:hypothetical protein [Caulobacteraceae bacterium]